jgi:type VI protein secretion system component VasF
MEKHKAYITHSWIWAIVAVVAFVGGYITISYMIHDSNITSVELKKLEK